MLDGVMPCLFLQICDFSAAKTFEHTTAHTMTGTFRWIAPEVCICAHVIM